MKPLILTAILLLTGCSIQLKDERIDAAKLEQLLFNHEVNLNAINGYIKALQEAKVLPLPKKEQDVQESK